MSASRHWRAVVGAGIGALLVMALAMACWLSRETAAPSTSVPVDASPMKAAVGPTGVGSPSAEPAVAAMSTITPRIEICGVGWFEKTADLDEEALWKRFEGRFTSARQDLVTTLLSNRDRFSQASGLIVQVWAGIDEQRKRNSAGEDVCTGPYCTDDSETHARVVDLAEQLAAMARSSDDPRLYALAFTNCRTIEATVNCASLSTRQWARLDAGNAAPWVWALDDASQRQDTAAIDEALFQIGHSQRQADRYFAVSAELVRQAGNDDAMLSAALSSPTGSVVAGVAALPRLTPLVNACRGKPIEDSNRRQLCEGVAELLASHADTTLMSVIGASIGGRLGWPVERVDAVRGLSLALAASVRPGPGDTNPSSCQSLKRSRARTLMQDKLGEVSGAKAWLLATGQPADAFTVQARADRLRSESTPARATASAPTPGAASEPAQDADPSK